MSSAAVGNTPRAEVASSGPVSASVTTRPSARVNTDRWDRSQRANALSIALARSANVWAGPTANTRPGYGHNCSPLPPKSSTLTDIHRRAMKPTLTHRSPLPFFLEIRRFTQREDPSQCPFDRTSRRGFSASRARHTASSVPSGVGLTVSGEGILDLPKHLERGAQRHLSDAFDADSVAQTREALAAL